MRVGGRAVTAILVIGLMYALLGSARGIAEGLREAGRLAATVDGLAIAMWFVLVRFSANRDQPGKAPADLQWGTLAAGALLGLAALGLAKHWSLPEERFHLPQYFGVALFMWWVAGERLGAALGLTLAVGLGDELVQAWLPQRTFDPRDLLANGGCGAAATLFLAGGRARWAAAPLLAVVWAVLSAFPPYIAPAPIALPTPEPAAPTPQAPPVLPASSTASISPSEAPYAGAAVVLITVDALRADHVEPWGRAPVPTPHLDRLARESVAFAEALSEAAWTSPGIVSLLTGLSPAVHGVETRGADLAPSVRTPLETLRDAGYRTLGFAGDDSETYRNLGFEAVLQRDVPPATALAAGLDALESADADAPFFAWLHLRQVHAPYTATPERLAELGLDVDLPDAPILTRARTAHTVPRSMFPGRHPWLRDAIRALYAAEVADADAALGDVLALLEERGLQERAVIVLSADHGEELLENHGIGHASTTLDTAPHPEVTRIPLLIRLPDGRGRGKVVPERFVQSDLVPTLLPLLGVAPEAPGPGVPLSGRDHSAAVLDGPSLKASHPRDPDHVPPTRAVLLSTSPCGWQCPDDRRGERLHAWLDGAERTFCRTRDGDTSRCDPVLQDALAEAARRQAALGTPVPAEPAP